jgi:hypothetical protein
MRYAADSGDIAPEAMVAALIVKGNAAAPPCGLAAGPALSIKKNIYPARCKRQPDVDTDIRRSSRHV